MRVLNDGWEMERYFWKSSNDTKVTKPRTSNPSWNCLESMSHIKISFTGDFSLISGYDIGIGVCETKRKPFCHARRGSVADWKFSQFTASFIVDLWSWMWTVSTFVHLCSAHIRPVWLTVPLRGMHEHVSLWVASLPFALHEFYSRYADAII